MDRSKLEKIYRIYGFEVDNSQINVAVFLYKKGRYFGADIVPLDQDLETLANAENIRNEYSEMGYATTLKTLSNEEEAELELFKSFFSYDSTLERLKKKYKDFTNKQKSHLFGHEYQYIECPFEIYDSQEDNSKQRFIELIKNKIQDNSGANLIIIEAAAGYGKTSTAYELLNCIINNPQLNKIPIFTELARNRGAKIFRYILLDEIDTEFQTLNSTLVMKEITEGRIPVIIDGFDELLTKISLEADIATLDEVEPMLNTIGNLLTGNAKVILTTRKTAIFNGVEFEKWKSQWRDSFSVTRISIKEPSIQDWLGCSKIQYLEHKNMNLGVIANPVILTYLRNLPKDEFDNEIDNSDLLVKKYFRRILEREKERQGLLMTVEDQYEVFKNVVQLLIEFDISSEGKEFFKEIIKEQNTRLLEKVRTYYPEKPTIDNLVDTLATHALLDRKGKDGNHIGFINDFVFGILIGEIINSSTSNDLMANFSTYMIELAVTAYKVQSQNQRDDLWEKLISISSKFSAYTLFNFDIILKNSICSNYTNLDIKELNFYDIKFDQHTISNTAFVNSKFKNCCFDTTIFEGVTFIGCFFDNCTVVNSKYLNEDYEHVTVIKCSEDKTHILSDAVMYSQRDNQIEELQSTILKIMWDHAELKKHLISSFLRKIEGFSHKKISIAINELEIKKLIHVRGNNIEFNLNKLSTIKSLLGKG